MAAGIDGCIGLAVEDDFVGASVASVVSYSRCACSYGWTDIEAK